MILDAQLLFDEAAQHLTTEASTNIVDLSIARDIGSGEDLYFVILVSTAFTDGGSDSTQSITLETDNDSAFGSPTTAAQTVGTFAALSAVGTRLVVKLQPEKINERYMRVKYTVANGDLTTGNFTAFLCKDVDRAVAYAHSYVIS